MGQAVYWPPHIWNIRSLCCGWRNLRLQIAIALSIPPTCQPVLSFLSSHLSLLLSHLSSSFLSIIDTTARTIIIDASSTSCGIDFNFQAEVRSIYWFLVDLVLKLMEVVMKLMQWLQF